MKVNYDFLNPGEQIVMEGFASKQQLTIDKFGQLILTDQRLVFIANSFNLGSKFLEIPLSEVAFSGGMLAILRVGTRNGKTFRFSVKNRDQWAEKLSEAVKRYKAQ